MPKIEGFDHFVLTVADIATSVAFYTNVLCMKSEVFQPTDASSRTALRFGSYKINLHQAGREFAPNAQTATCGSGDFCLVTKAPLSDWIDHLKHLDVMIEEGPVPRTGANGPIESLYLRDPDGNLVEIARYT